MKTEIMLFNYKTAGKHISIITYLRPNILEPRISTNIKSTKRIKNKTLAIPAALAAIPV